MPQPLPIITFKRYSDGPDQNERTGAFDLHGNRLPDDLGTIVKRARKAQGRTLERTGWRYWLYRWYHNDEPLRNDAARLLKESGYQFMKPIGSRSIAEDM